MNRISNLILSSLKDKNPLVIRVIENHGAVVDSLK